MGQLSDSPTGHNLGMKPTHRLASMEKSPEYIAAPRTCGFRQYKTYYCSKNSKILPPFKASQRQAVRYCPRWSVKLGCHYLYRRPFPGKVQLSPPSFLSSSHPSCDDLTFPTLIVVRSGWLPTQASIEGGSHSASWDPAGPRLSSWLGRRLWPKICRLSRELLAAGMFSQFPPLPFPANHPPSLSQARVWSASRDGPWCHSCLLPTG